MANQPARRQQRFRVKAITVAVASCFAVSAEVAFAQAVLPTGGVVTAGQASPFVYKDNTLSITTQTNAAINWQTFSIGANGKVIFYQPSAANSVLNRVIGVDPSSILGAMQSNGRVFLINPNGILFGAGAKIDVAGLVASTLNLSNADFLAGRMRFTETPGAGKIDNQGAITTPSGGQVYLIAPDVKNSGIITSPQGEVILAAGRSVEIVDAGTPTLRVEITAPDTQAVNIGQIIANGGKIGIFAGLIKNSGEIRADGVVVGQNGEILLKATQNVTLENGSVITASGPTAGKITIQSDSGAVAITGRVEANATQGTGGTINISAPQGITVDSGARISAAGNQGGNVTLTAAGPLRSNITAARPSEITLSAATATLTSGKQISVAGSPTSGTLTVDMGNAVTLTTGTAVGEMNLTAAEGAIAVAGTIDVSGTEGRGGSIHIAARNDITLDVTSRLLARGRAGGEVRVEATKGTLLAGGLIDGRGSDGPGGSVYLLAPRVALIRRALIDVSGALGGGMVLFGGDFQGRNPFIQNSSRAYFGPDAIIRADAGISGDGGKVIIWSDDGTQAYGTISARGGALSGNGGFVETSGKAWLDFSATVDTSAPHGAFGMLLLDPKNIDVNDTGGSAYGGNNLFADNPGGLSIIKATGAGSISAQMTPVFLQADNDITFTSAIDNPNAGVSLTAQAGRSILVNADIKMTNADITLTANESVGNGVNALNRDAGAAVITMLAGKLIDAGDGDVRITMGTGAGHAGEFVSGNITLAKVTGRDMFFEYLGYDSNSNILMADAASVITARSLIIDLWNPANPSLGSGSIGTQLLPIKVTPNAAFGANINIEAHEHVATGGIFIQSTGHMRIGAAVLFGGGAKGVQTLSGGPIELTAAGTLTQLPGTAICGTGGGTGGPICANSNSNSNVVGTVKLTADGDIFINNVVEARGHLSYYDSNIVLGSPVAAVDITSNNGTVTITSTTVQAIGSVQADGAEGHTITVNAPIAAVNIKGKTGVDIQTSTIFVNGNLDVSGYCCSNTTVVLNKSIAVADIQNTDPAGSGVTINGGSITVNGTFQALDEAMVTLTTAAAAPIAALNITGTGTNGVTLSGPTFTVNGAITANASSYDDLSINATLNAPVAALNINGTTSTGTSGVTVSGAWITVDGAISAIADGAEGFSSAYAYVNLTTASTAPIATVNITGNSGTASGVTITSSTINVFGEVAASAYANYNAYAEATIDAMFNAPVAAMSITGTGGAGAATGVTLDAGTSINVDGRVKAFAEGNSSNGSAYAGVDFTTTTTAPIATMNITGNGGTTSGVSITGSTINVNGAVVASAYADSDAYAEANIDATLNGPVAALSITGTGGATATTGVTLDAGAAIMVDGKVFAYAENDGGEGSAIAGINFTTASTAPIATLSITGNGGTTSGVSITGSTINVYGSVVASADGDSDGYAEANIYATLNAPVAALSISTGGAVAATGVTLDAGTAITVDGRVVAYADASDGNDSDANGYVNFTTASTAPIATASITGTGSVSGVSITGSTINVNGTVLASAYAHSDGYAQAGIDGTLNGPVAALKITGTGNAGATSGVALDATTTLSVDGGVQARADGAEGFFSNANAYVNFTTASTAPIATLSIIGQGSPATGVLINGSTINVSGYVGASADGNSSASAYANIDATLNGPVAALSITGTGGAGGTSSVTLGAGTTLFVEGLVRADADGDGGEGASAYANFTTAATAPIATVTITGNNGPTTGVSITGSTIDVQGSVHANANSGSAGVSGTLNAPLASATIDGKNGEVTITSSMITVTATISSFESNGNAYSDVFVNGPAATASITSSAGNISIDSTTVSADGAEGDAGSATVTVAVTAGTGNVSITSGSLLVANGTLSGSGSGGGILNINTPVAAVDIKSANGTVTVDSSTVEATGTLQGQGGAGGGYTVNLNAPVAVVNLTGGNGVIIEDAPGTISATANLSFYAEDGGTFNFNVNAPTGYPAGAAAVAAVNITGNGAGPDSGVRITGSAITVAANLSAYANSTSAMVNLNVASGAPVAGVKITGAGVKGVTIDSGSTITVTGQVNGYAYASYGYLNVGGIINAPLAAVNITGTGTGAATSGVTITDSTIAVSGQLNAEASYYSQVDINNTLNAPLANVVIGGSGGTTNGVTITGPTTITVSGQMNGYAMTSGSVNVNSTLNAPLASLNISSGNGVSITGTGVPLITVDGRLYAEASSFAAVNFNGTINAPLAVANISGNGGAVNGVTLTTSPLTVSGSFVAAGSGSSNFSGVINPPGVFAAVANVTSTSGNINFPGSPISVSADDGGMGVLASKILLQTTNGFILGDALSGLSATNNDIGGPSPLIELRATKGIGAIGNPVFFVNDNADVIAINSGSTGDLVLGEVGDVNIDNFANIVNTAPGGVIDITALGGNLTISTAVSNPSGRLTLRSGLAGGTLTVDGAEGGMLTTGAGAGHDISLIADNVDLSNLTAAPVVKSGSDFVNVLTYTPGRPIWLGSAGGGGGQLELSNTELNLMTNLAGNGGGLVIGDSITGGALTFKGPVDSTAFLNVRGSSITQIGGATITGGLNVIASGNVTLTDAGNQIDFFTTGANVGGSIALVTVPDVDLSGVSATGNVNITSSTGAITTGGSTLVHAGGSMSLTSATGMSVLVDSNGAGLTASNTGATGDLVLTSTAPTFTIGGGGATFSNAAPTGTYAITADNNMVLNGGTANDRQALFGAGGMLTVDGYSNASGQSVSMVATNVTFNGGATIVGGPLFVYAGGTIDVNTTVEGLTVDVITGALNVNGGDFRTAVGGGGSFSGYVVGDVTVSGGGRIYGDVDVLGPPTAFDSGISALTVGGTIIIDGAGSRIEAGSPTSIIVYFPLITEGGYVVNGVTGQVWDTATSTGFFAGGLPAELGSSLRVFYQSGLPAYVVSAINTTIASINESTESPVEDEEQKDNKEKPSKDEKSISTNLKLQCN